MRRIKCWFGFHDWSTRSLPVGELLFLTVRCRVCQRRDWEVEVRVHPNPQEEGR